MSANRARWLKAEQHYRKALALNPVDPLIHIFMEGCLQQPDICTQP